MLACLLALLPVSLTACVLACLPVCMSVCCSLGSSLSSARTLNICVFRLLVDYRLLVGIVGWTVVICR